MEAIAFEQQEGGQIVVEAKIGAGPEVPLILDSGASVTVLSPEIWAEAGLGPPDGRHLRVTAAAGDSGGRLVHRVPLQLGGDAFSLPAVVVLDRDDSGPAAYGGVLGRDFLSQVVVELDFERHELRLLDRAPDGVGIAVRRTHASLTRTTAAVGGSALPAIVDLGASASILDRRAAEALPVDPDCSATAYGADGNPIQADCVRASVTIGSATVDGLSLYAADLPIFARLGLDRHPAMVLGLDVLARHRLVLDLGGGRMWLD